MFLLAFICESYSQDTELFVADKTYPKPLFSVFQTEGYVQILDPTQASLHPE